MLNAFTHVLTAVLIQPDFGSLSASVSIAFAFSVCCLHYHALVYFLLWQISKKKQLKENNIYCCSFSDFTVHSWWLFPLFLDMGCWPSILDRYYDASNFLLCCCIREIKGGGRREREGRSRKELEHVYPRHASRD